MTAAQPVPSTLGGLRYGRLRTADLPERERRQAYLELLDGVLDTDFLTPRFDAELDAFNLGPLNIVALKSSERCSARTATRIAHDRYDAISVQLAIEGLATGIAHGAPVISMPGSIMILDYTRPFAITDLAPRSVVNVAIPRLAFPPIDRDLDAVHGLVLSGGASDMLGAFLASLAPTLDAVPAEVGPSLGEMILDLLAIALGEYVRRGDVPHDAHRQIIARAARAVDARIGSADLNPAWLMAKLNISRADLYACMERFGGAGRFILGRRLGAARAALSNAADNRRIGDIAYAFGFSSEGHFSRSFRAAFAETPTAVRREAGRKGG